MSTTQDIDISMFLNKTGTEKPAPVELPLDSTVATVVSELRAIFNGDLSKERIMAAIHQGVLVMRKFKVSGAQKKTILSEALYFAVDHSLMPPEDRAACRVVLDVGLSDAVDNLVFMATAGIKMKSGCGCFR